MSRIGNKTIVIPEGVTVEVNGNHVVAKGPKGTIEKDFHPAVKVEINGQEAKVTIDNPKDGYIHGTMRTVLANMIEGVHNEFTKTLEINGVGYRAVKQGKGLTLSLGFSHPVKVEAPAGITLDAPAANQIVVSGADKEAVGAMAAKIRAFREPEPYKGKGIKYAGEHIRRKVGKAGAKGKK